MPTKKPIKTQGKSNHIVGGRELIVVTRADAGVRTTRGAIASATGADVAPLEKLVSVAGIKLNPLFGDSEESLAGGVYAKARDGGTRGTGSLDLLSCRSCRRTS